MKNKVSTRSKVMLILVGALMGIVMTLSLIFISQNIAFLPFKVKVAFVETKEPGNNNDAINQEEGYVRNSDTAVKIAEAVWLDIYGEEIYDEKPFVAVLENDVWTVNGTLPESSLGGTARIKISKQDGRILEVYHGK